MRRMFVISPEHTLESVFAEFETIFEAVYSQQPDRPRNIAKFYDTFLNNVSHKKWTGSPALEEIRLKYSGFIIECWIFQQIVMVTADRMFVKFVTLKDLSFRPKPVARDASSSLVAKHAYGYAPTGSIVARELSQRSPGSFARLSV